MAKYYRERTIRPSSRKPISTSYKVDTTNIGVNDDVHLVIKHEDGRILGEYDFSGKQIAGRKSIHFRYINDKVLFCNTE